MISVPQLPQIAGFDDPDPLAADPSVDPRSIRNGETDPVLLVGSDSTIANLAALYMAEWDMKIADRIRRSGHVTWLCGAIKSWANLSMTQTGSRREVATVEGLGHPDVHRVLAPL